MEEYPEGTARGSPTSKTQENNNIKAIASRYLGRFWAVQSPQRETPSLSLSLIPAATSASRSANLLLRRTVSKQRFSTLSSFDGSSDIGSARTATTMSRSSTEDQRNSNKSTVSVSS